MQNGICQNNCLFQIFDTVRSDNCSNLCLITCTPLMDMCLDKQSTTRDMTYDGLKTTLTVYFLLFIIGQLFTVIRARGFKWQNLNTTEVNY